jgi:GTP cyclohydrolase I
VEVEPQASRLNEGADCCPQAGVCRVAGRFRGGETRGEENRGPKARRDADKAGRKVVNVSVDRDRIAAAVREILDAIGEDVTREGLRETPTRVADAMAEMFAGIGVDATTGLREAGSTADVVSNDPVIVRDLAFRSMCEHHLLPFHGVAHVAYAPTDTVVGLGRIARVLDTIASRPQVQERIGIEVCAALTDGAGAAGVLVVLDARHDCVSARGARQADASAVTVTATGTLADEPIRSALLALIGRGDG